MDVQDAVKLAYTLRRQSRRGGLKIRADVAPKKEVVVVEGPNGRARRVQIDTGVIVFSGGKRGPHVLELSHSDEARVLAHWEGYLDANGMLAPTVDQIVDFESTSAPGGLRTGRVTKVGTKRATIAFVYKYGGKASKTVRFETMRWDPGPRPW
jgi:hypothetical protein